MSQTQETKTDQITGTMDKDYDLFRYIEGCLRTARRMETYRRDAEQDNDTALAALFTMTQNDSRKGAEIGKKLLVSRLAATGSAGAGEVAGTDADAGAATTEGASPGAAHAPETGEPAVEKPPVDVMAPATAPSRVEER
jgi:hypothetical protein